MVPGVTREFGTFSIFRQNGRDVEFLMQDENGRNWVNFDQAAYLSNRNKFLIATDKSGKCC